MKNKLIIFLGGMSESGKSFVGNFLETEENFKRIKIIEIEKELLNFYRIDFGKTKENFSQALKNLYFQQNVFEKFLEKIVEKSEGKNVSLESLYSNQLFLGIKSVYEKTFCIFIEADSEIRMQREYQKESHNGNKQTFEEFEKYFWEKENFKKEHKADLVKNVADFVVNNNGTIPELKKHVIQIINGLKV
ncbi:hypothetical protein ACW95P_02550 [Candidatus Mycoplasma pogonae]